MRSSFMPVDISAQDVELSTKRGPVYGPLSFTVQPGETVALVAGQSNGLSSLLLTLVGRMKPSGGTVTVGGITIPQHMRKVQKIATFAGFENLDDLDPALTIAEIAYERISLESPIIACRPGWEGEHMTSCLHAAFGTEPPGPDVPIEDLSVLGQAQARLFVALVCRPSVISYNDVDSLRNPNDQAALWESLQRASALGITIVANTANIGAIPEGVRQIFAERPDNDNRDESRIIDESADQSADQSTDELANEETRVDIPRSPMTSSQNDASLGGTFDTSLDNTTRHRAGSTPAYQHTHALAAEEANHGE